MQVLDELVDEKGTLIITESDSVACETCLSLLAWWRVGGGKMTDQFFNERHERM